MYTNLSQAEIERESWNERESSLIERGCSVVSYTEYRRGPHPVDGHHADTFHWSDPEIYFQLDMVAYSDYAGSSVDIANTRYMRESASYAEYTEERCGGYGTEWTVISRENINAMDDDTFEELISDLDYIQNDHPVLDEQLMYEVEAELANEAFDDWASRDFHSEVFNILHNTEGMDDIAEKWDDLVPSDAEIMADLFYRTAEHIGEYWINESGTSMHINVDRIAGGAVEYFLSDIVRLISRYTSK